MQRLVAQRLFGLGYEDLNDELRDDSLPALAGNDLTGERRGRDRSHPLAGPSALNRLEPGLPGEVDRYKRADTEAMDNLLIAPFLETFLAAWRDLVGRHRRPAARQPRERFFHGHYDCYLPLYVGNHVACSRLRPSNGAAGEELARIVERPALAGDRRSRRQRAATGRSATTTMSTACSAWPATPV